MALWVVLLSLLGTAGPPTPANPFQGQSGKTIMVISPHPDDDMVGCGGALAFLSGRGNRLVTVFLTSGEKGTFDASLTPETVARIRMQEAAAAYQVLGFSDAELIWLGYEDGGLDFAPPREVRSRLTHLIRARRPDIVFALDPGATYYRYHYRDHRSAALASADAIGAAMWPAHDAVRAKGLGCGGFWPRCGAAAMVVGGRKRPEKRDSLFLSDSVPKIRLARRRWNETTPRSAG